PALDPAGCCIPHRQHNIGSRPCRCRPPAPDRSASPVPLVEELDSDRSRSRGGSAPVQSEATVTGAKWLATALVFVLAVPDASAPGGRVPQPAEVNAPRHGQVTAYPHTHAADTRIWSPALHQGRALYVYVPPGSAPRQCYPVILWFHGID